MKEVENWALAKFVVIFIRDHRGKKERKKRNKETPFLRERIIINMIRRKLSARARRLLAIWISEQRGYEAHRDAGGCLLRGKKI